MDGLSIFSVYYYIDGNQDILCSLEKASRFFYGSTKRLIPKDSPEVVREAIQNAKKQFQQVFGKRIGYEILAEVMVNRCCRIHVSKYNILID